MEMNLKCGPRQRDKEMEAEWENILSKNAAKLKRAASVRRPDKIITVSKSVHACHTVSFNFVSNNNFLEYFSNDYDCDSEQKKKLTNEINGSSCANDSS